MTVKRLLNWHVRRVLRRHELPDLPETRRALRARAQHGWTFGASPGYRELRALHDEAVMRAIAEEEHPITGNR